MKLLGTLALALWTGAGALAAPPPAEAFFTRPSVSEARLSPDGRSVAMLLAPKGQRTRLAVVDLNTMAPKVALAFDDQDVAQFSWVNAQRLVLSMRTELTGPGFTDTGHGLYAVNADGSAFRQLVTATGSNIRRGDDGPALLHWATSTIFVPGLASGNDIVVGRPEEMSRERIGYFSLQRLNTATGRTTDIDAPLHAANWAFDSNGTLRAAVTANRGRGAVHLNQGDGRWQQLEEFDRVDGANLIPRWVGPDGTVYVQADHRGHSALFALDTATGRPRGEPLAASKDFDIHPEFIYTDKKLLGLRYTIDAEVTQWLDPGMKALQERIDKLLPATANRISVARQGESPWVLIEAWSDVQPTVTLVFQRETGKLTKLGSRQPDIDPKQMGQTDFVRYKARDGLEIPAWLTLPPGGGSKLPMVVLVHGGPWTRGAEWGWNAEVQFLASRGYAVLQPEFRGSTGYGRKHFEAGFKQWGRAMQDDIADGARWAIAQGHADARRICIAGASYGGYATLMGLARDPDLFRCGIDWVGVTDIEMLFTVGWSDTTKEVKTYGMPRMIGDPQADAEMLKAASPLANAARIRQPLLMAYGAWDVRVPLVHGEKFRDAVKPHNPALEWVLYDKEGHGWDRLETRLDFWGRVERFLARHTAARD